MLLFFPLQSLTTTDRVGDERKTRSDCNGATIDLGAILHDQGEPCQDGSLEDRRRLKSSRGASNQPEYVFGLRSVGKEYVCILVNRQETCELE